MTKSALVVTSISSPNKALTSWAEGSLKHGLHYIVIGDTDSPGEFNLPGSDFWSVKRQKVMEFSLAERLPKKHYARKNLGYLHAIEKDAPVIIETDDDVFPRDDFWNERKLFLDAKKIAHSGWVNVYRYFTDAHIWPRGFPLEFVQQPVPPLPEASETGLCCPIQQGLVDDSPDVDAVYRLVQPLPQTFAHGSKIALASDAWAPFNSLNTTWFQQAFPLLYLPSYCSFRTSSIMRSFVAQRICWENDWHILHHGPTVWQERNEHDLLKDFEAEIPGFLNCARITAELAVLKLRSGTDHLGENLMACYRSLIKLGVVGKAELHLLQAWLDDLKKLM